MTQWPRAARQPPHSHLPAPHLTDQHLNLGESSVASRRPPTTSPAPLLPSHCPCSSAESSGVATAGNGEPGFRGTSAGFWRKVHSCVSFTQLVLVFHPNRYHVGSHQHSQTLNSQRHFSTKRRVLSESFQSQFSHLQNENTDDSQVPGQLRDYRG